MTVLDPLTTCANAISSRLTTAIPGLKAYTYEPPDVQLSPVPGFVSANAVTIGGVAVKRIGPDEIELEIGAAASWGALFGVPGLTTYYTSWRVTLYSQLQVLTDSTSFDDARRLCSAVISAVDADPTLGGVAMAGTGDGARVTGTSWGYTPKDQPVQMIICEATLEAWIYV